MADTSHAWARLLDYRERLPGWMRREVSLADTRLRVSRLLDAGFGFGWDDLEADVEAMGHRADFVLRVDGRRWGVVIVRPMGTGPGGGIPPEAYVLADGAGLRWTWVTDGVALSVWHVGPDLVARPVSALDLCLDSEDVLRAAWDRLCREGIGEGRLEAHRLSLLRPTPADVRSALQSPAVVAALRQTLTAAFPQPGTDDDLATLLNDVLDGIVDAAETPPLPPPPMSRPAATDVAPAPPAANGHDRVPASVNGHSPVASVTNGHPPGAALPAPDGHPPVPETPMRDAPGMAASPGVTIPAPAAPAPVPPAAGPATPGPSRRKAPAPDSLLSAMEKQRQTHERLRQNLQDLRDNRARLQDALVEMQRDYPDRLERPGSAPTADPVAAGARPASWTLLGHLQSMGNGYWEWCAADDGGQGVRLN